jgi:hypothetical protein
MFVLTIGTKFTFAFQKELTYTATYQKHMHASAHTHASIREMFRTDRDDAKRSKAKTKRNARHIPLREPGLDEGGAGMYRGPISQ